MGTLYIVGTPIGNLEDLTLRAARVLGQVGLVAAEDTRVTRRLLSHLGIRVRTLSYHQHNWRARLPSVLEALEEQDVALVCDAGMPGISDPGSELVARATADGIRVEVVPGPSAVTTALAVSGFTGDAFTFLGFLPRRRKDRRQRLQSFAAAPTTLVLFEAPHRLKVTLQDLLSELGDREAALCRELTKFHEEVIRGRVSQVLEHAESPKGEYVVIVAGAPEHTPEPVTPDASREQAASQLADLRGQGTRAKDAVAQVADSLGLPKNLVYQLWLETGRQQG